MKVSEAIELDYSLWNKCCAFCESVLNLDSVSCYECETYKGVMTIRDFIREYNSPIY